MTRGDRATLSIGDPSREDHAAISAATGVRALPDVVHYALRQVTSAEAAATPDPGGEGAPKGGVRVALGDEDVALAHAVCRDAKRREETSAGVRIALRALANRLKKTKRVARIARRKESRMYASTCVSCRSQSFEVVPVELPIRRVSGFEPAAGYASRWVHLVQCVGCGNVIGSMDPSSVAAISEHVADAISQMEMGGDGRLT